MLRTRQHLAFNGLASWRPIRYIGTIAREIAIWSCAALVAGVIGVAIARGYYQVTILGLAASFVVLLTVKPTLGVLGAFLLSTISLPLIFGDSFDVGGFPADKFVSALIALAVTSVHRSHDRSSTSRSIAPTGLLVMYSLFLLLQLPRGGHVREGISFGVELLLFPVLVLAYSRARGYSQIAMQAYVPMTLLALFGTVFAAPILLGHRGLATVTEAPGAVRAVGFVGSSVLGLTAGLLSASLLSQYVEPDSTLSRAQGWLRRCALTGGVLALLLSASRTAALGLLVAAGVVVVLRSGKISHKLLGLALGLLIIVLALEFTPLGSRVLAPSQSQNLVEGTWQGRVNLWNAIWHAWKNSSVLLGFGLGGTRSFFGPHQIFITGAGNVHNEYLRILAELGVVGMAFYMACFWFILKSRYPQDSSARPSHTHWRRALPFLVYVLIVIFPENFFELVPQMLVPAAMLMGFLLGPSDRLMAVTIPEFPQ